MMGIFARLNRFRCCQHHWNHMTFVATCRGGMEIICCSECGKTKTRKMENDDE